MRFYTYLHRTKDTGQVFYIGKGVRDRYKVTTGRSERWSRKVAVHGFTTEIAARWPTESEAFDHERLLILCFKDMGFDLVNHTDGGEGASGFKQSEDTKEKRNRKLRGRKRSPETIARMKVAQANKVMREEQKAKLSAYWTGRSCGRNNPSAKRCMCIETGVEFDTYTLAGKWLNSLGHDKASFKNIAAVISGKKKTAYGYQWAPA